LSALRWFFINKTPTPLFGAESDQYSKRETLLHQCFDAFSVML
jgi:hypothetical protein